MTTPQRKFFDKVKKEFPENQDEYFIRNDGLIFKICSDRLFNITLLSQENIIVAPFTGRYAKKHMPIYDQDIVVNESGQKFLVYFCQIQFCFKLKGRGSVPLYSEACFKIIGSALTNPELLDEK